MKKTKIAALLYYVAAVLIDLFALFLIFQSHNLNAGLVMLCIGSAMLCFGGTLANRYAQETEKQQDEENKK